MKSKSAILAMCLYSWAGIVMLAPFASLDKIPKSNDMQNHLFLVVEAGRAIREGQFPLRVSPQQHSGWGYPQFQFYSSLPYSVGAWVQRAACPDNPYLALKVVFWLAFWLGGMGVFLGLRTLNINAGAALLAGLAYLSSPYLLFNLTIRSHVTELLAQGLLAVWAWRALELCLKPSLQAAVWVAIVGALVGMTHHITFIYGSVFVFMIGLMLRWRSWPALAAALTGSLLLTAYIYVPVLIYRYSVYITAFTKPFRQFFVPLPALLSVGPAYSANSLGGEWPPHFFPAVGILFVLAAGGWTWTLFNREPTGPLRKWVTPMLFLFAGSFFVSWSPVDFWQHIPRPLWFVQFPFRFLTYAALSGAFLLGALLQDKFSNVPSRAHLLVGSPILFLLAYPWVQITEPQVRMVENGRPPQGTGLSAGFYDYLYCPHPFLTRSELFATSDVDWKRLRDQVPGITDPASAVDWLNSQIGSARLPDVVRADRLVFPPNIAALYARYRAGQPLAPEEQRKLNRAALQLRFRAVLSRTYLPLLEDNSPLSPGDVDVAVDRTAPSFRREKGSIRGELSLVRRSVVQLPVLHYPGLMRLTVDGVATQALSSLHTVNVRGELVQMMLATVPLDPGSHRIEARFTGHRTANVVSAAAWVAALGLLALGWRARRPN